MIEIKEKDNCCGCFACINICPKKAIQMKIDEKGFKYPIVDKEKCINCGLCKKVCPILNQKQEEKKELKAYACYNKNKEERTNSSSGGIFILIAKEIIKRNGVVFGAAFDKEYNVAHSYAENEEELKKFMGSKYVQSTIGDTYKKVKEFLEKDRYVLFTGTPCQIEGLKSYLQKDYEKLYTQDIVCHGVPSPLVWNKYKEYRQKKDNNSPTEISFRNKDDGWKLFNMKFSYRNSFYKKNQNEDLFMKAFLRNTILRDSCYNCKFKKKNRVSDITLADYWGINNIHPNIDDNMGTSLVVTNSEKGNEIFKIISEYLTYTETDLEEAIIYNKAYISSVSPDTNREKFFQNLNNMNFDTLVAKYTYQIPIHKKILNKIRKIIKSHK